MDPDKTEKEHRPLYQRRARKNHPTTASSAPIVQETKPPLAKAGIRQPPGLQRQLKSPAIHAEQLKNTPNSNVNQPTANSPDVQSDAAATSPTSPEDGAHGCPVCTENISIFALGSCNHPLCHLCWMRLRSLYQSPLCALCKTECKKLVFTRNPIISFQDVEPRLKQMPYDKKLGINFESPDIQEEAMALLRFRCPELNCPVECSNGLAALKKHVKQAHHKVFCEICVEHKKIFINEHTLFTTKSLQEHIQQGDADDPSFKGHPECGFCSRHFYSNDELFEHCRAHHENCHICQRNGVHHEYYKDYSNLEMHFRESHFFCEEEICLEKKFVVFETEVDLKAHQAREHRMPMSRQQQRQANRLDVQIQFKDRPSSSRRGPYGGAVYYNEDTGSSTSVALEQRDFPQLRTNGAETSSTRVGSSSTHRATSDWQSSNQAPPKKPSSASNSKREKPFVTEAEFKSADRKVSASDSQKTDDRPQSGSSNAATVSSKNIFDQQNGEDGRIKAAEETVGPLIADAFHRDLSKWKMFRQLCKAFLEGKIMAASFYNQFEVMLADKSQFDTLAHRIMDLFPQVKQPALRRALNDRKAREDTFPSLTPAAFPPPKTSDGSGPPTQDKKSKAKVLVIKPKSAMPSGRFGMGYARSSSSSSLRQSSASSVSSLTSSLDDEQHTSALKKEVQEKEEDLAETKQSKGKSKKRQKGVLLFSTALTASADHDLAIPSNNLPKPSTSMEDGQVNSVGRQLGNLNMAPTQLDSPQFPSLASTLRAQNSTNSAGGGRYAAAVASNKGRLRFG